MKNLTPEQIEEQRRTTEKWQQLWEKMLALVNSSSQYNKYDLDAHEVCIPQRKERAFTFEALVLTQQLIELNPDCYTPWNYRKQILSSKLSMKSRVEPEPTPVESIEQAITENTESPGENKQDEVPKEEGAEIPNSDAVKDEPKEVQPTVEDEEEKKRKQQELEEQAKIKEIEQEKLEKEAQEKELKELEETITLRQKKELIRKDLTEITIRAIRHNHKSYNVWYHRRWIMLQMKKLSEAIHAGLEVKHSSDTLSDDVDWKCDLDLTTQFLKLDSRNCTSSSSTCPKLCSVSLCFTYEVHCWGYRKFIVQESNVPAEKELEYTETKIGEGGKFFSDGGGKAAQECSFSNYSAWHLRSILLTQQIESIKKSETEAPEQQIKELLDTGIVLSLRPLNNNHLNNRV